MSKNIAQRRKRLATLVTQTLEVYKKDVPRFDEWVVLINKRTDKIFEMLTYILSQKDPKIPNSLKPGIMKCVTCIDGIKRIYLQHDSKNKILLHDFWLYNTEKHIVYFSLPDETFLISKDIFDQAVFDETYTFHVTEFRNNLRSLEPIEFDIESIPSDFFSFQILESKKILIQQPFRDNRQTLVNINEIDTLFHPMIDINMRRYDIDSSFVPRSIFSVTNSFEENLLNDRLWNSHLDARFLISKRHDHVQHLIFTNLDQLFNIHYYLNNPEVVLVIRANAPPYPDFSKTILSDLFSLFKENCILSKMELTVSENSYNLHKSAVWRF